jgi:hypothetical protein
MFHCHVYWNGLVPPHCPTITSGAELRQSCVPGHVPQYTDWYFPELSLVVMPPQLKLPRHWQNCASLVYAQLGGPPSAPDPELELEPELEPPSSEPELEPPSSEPELEPPSSEPELPLDPLPELLEEPPLDPLEELAPLDDPLSDEPLLEPLGRP